MHHFKDFPIILTNVDVLVENIFFLFLLFFFQHGNCPICREDLNGKKSNSKDSSSLDHEESHSRQNFQFPSQ